MKTTIVEGFEVVEADGGGMGENHVAYFSNERAATQLSAQSPGWMRVRPFKQTIVVCESFGEYVIQKNEEVKAKALAKLTAEERAALGF